MTGEGVDNFDIDIFCERNELIMIKKIHFPPGNSMIIYIYIYAKYNCLGKVDLGLHKQVLIFSFFSQTLLF